MSLFPTPIKPTQQKNGVVKRDENKFDKEFHTGG